MAAKKTLAFAVSGCIIGFSLTANLQANSEHHHHFKLAH